MIVEEYFVYTCSARNTKGWLRIKGIKLGKKERSY